MNKKAIQEYTNFRKNSKFTINQLIVKNDQIWVDDFMVQDESGKKYCGNENFINVAYTFKDNLSKCLSNLSRYSFIFRGKKVSSIECVLQGIKQKDKKLQNLIFEYYGLEAYHMRASNFCDDWTKNGVLYWQGKKIDRNSEDYQIFLDELYLSVAKNPLFLKILKATENKYLLHHFGGVDKTQTVLTREEYEIRLNTLRDFLKYKKVI